MLAFLALCSGLLPAALGCTSNVIVGGQGGSGGSEPSGPGGGVPTGGGGTDGGTTISPSSGKAQPAEGGYLVTLADYPHACGDQGIQPNCSTTAWWDVRFALPSSALAPGTILPFDQLNGFFSEQLAMESGQSSCGFGGGTFDAGTVEIISASATEIVMKVAGTGAVGFPKLGIDATYTVPICDSTPPVDDGKAIAMKFSQTPGNNGDTTASCTSVGGQFTDPDTLMLFVSNSGQSCNDPYHYQQGCVAARYQVAIQLLVSQQAVGTYPLGGQATVSLSQAPNQPGSCSGGGGGYWGGTINVTAINATSVTFTLTGTADVGLGFGNVDGTYTAPRCF
jgi:hypothetical protein